MNRFDFFTSARPCQKNPIDAGIDADLATCDRPLKALTAQRSDASDDHQRRILPRHNRRVQLARELRHRNEFLALLLAIARWQERVLDGQSGHPGRFQFLDRSHHIQGIAVAMIGVDHQTQGTGTSDAVDLLGKLGQGQDHDVRGAEDGTRGG